MDLAARTLEVVDWPFVARELARHARTPAGRRAAESIALSTDPHAIGEALDAVEETLALVESGAGAPPVGGVEDVAPVVERAARGEVLDLADLRAAGSTLAALTELSRFLARNAASVPTLARIAAPIALDAKLCATFAAAFDERGELSERTYPLLGELRRRIAALERRMRSVLESLLDSAELSDVLQDRYVAMRGDRFVVPVKAHAKNMGLGIVHDSSRTGQTVFVEPQQVVPIGNEKRVAESDLLAEERRIRAELSVLLGRHAGVLLGALAAATAIDVTCARSDFARRLDATRPHVGSDGVVELRTARHPVLALSKTAVVANDLSLTPSRPVLVLTGPNAGGKTVALKTIGLCALLVRSGCFVPAAEGSRVDVFDDVLADIGDMQTVHEGLSSFSAHLTTLRAMLERAGDGTLLLLDEVAAGTDPSQGGALARAVIERLADRGARVVATTHYAQVKAMSAQDERVEVAALEYRDGKPTYRVVPGMAGESHALAAALRVGIDEAIVERARGLMDEGERALQDAVAALETERARSEDLARRAELAATSMEARERTLAEREKTLRRNARELEEREAMAFVARLREAEREVRRVVAELQRNPSLDRAARVRTLLTESRAAAEPGPQIRDARDARHSGDDADGAADETGATKPRAARVGDRVRVVRLGATGEVISAGEQEIEVRAGSMTLRVKPAEVEILRPPADEPRAAPGTRRTEGRGAHSPTGGASTGPRRAASSGATPQRRAGEHGASAIENALRVPANTLDLRGARVEDALAQLESFLDAAMLDSRDVVFVLHGHGTGALKSAIRRALADSPYVSSSAPAAEDQGGDAFTVARLRG